MRLIDIPAKWTEAWGKNTPGSNIRTIPVTTATPGFASQDQGFSPVNAIPVGAGGVPPFIQDMNGVLNLETAWTIWLAAAGNAIPFDATYSAVIGGYPAGVTVLSGVTFGRTWTSQVDNNTSNPDTGGANWVQGSLFGSLSSGDVKLSYKTVADPGFVMMNNGSIGDGSSGATTRANADTLNAFTVMYNNISDANAPIQTSGGGATTRAAQGTAAAAFAAHCRLVLPAALGRAIGVAGAGAGLTVRALGQSLGEENHLLTVAEIPSHTHANTLTDLGHFHTVPFSGAQQFSQAPGAAAPITPGPQSTSTEFSNISINNAAVGGGGSHNIMQPTTFVSAMLAL